MRNKLAILLLLILIPFILPGQNLTVYHVPKVNTGSDEAPSIAANRYGDILVTYRNGWEGLMYYWKKHNTDSWIGPATVPGQPYGTNWGGDIFNTDIVVTKDGKFHVMWCMLNAAQYGGLHYIKFDPVNENWSEYEHVVPSAFFKTEEPRFGINPRTQDLIMIWTWVIGFEKNVYIKYKNANGWSDSIDISQVWVLAETNPWIGFDEEGRTYVIYKIDWIHGEIEELVIRMHLLDEDNGYAELWRDELTWEYNGWHFLPSVAGMKGGTGMATFAWMSAPPSGYGYYWIDFKTEGATVTYNSESIPTNFIAHAPVTPWYEYHSLLVPYVDEYVFFYKDPVMSVKMQRRRDGEWIDRDAPIPIAEGESSTWPFDGYAEPSVGIMAAWTVRGDVGTIGFSIYDATKIIIQPPVNGQLLNKQERSYFQSYNLNRITWENDPYNIENEINITKYIIYRRTKGTLEYTKLDEVAATVFEYIDTEKIGATNPYDYAVSAVDDSENESLLLEISG